MIDVRHLMTLGVTGRYPTNPSDIIGVATHHSVSGGQFFTARVMTFGDELNHLRMIDQYHVSIGFGGFAYHMAAFPSGRYYLTGSLGGARAHVASRNHELIGFLLIGDFTAVAPPPTQIAAAAACLAFIRQTYPGRPNKGHRDWALPGWGTSCPGDTWQAWLSALEPSTQEEDIVREEDFTRIRAIMREELAATHPAVGTAPAPAGRTYTVQDGDSLWVIAARFYGDGTRYPDIRAANGLTEASTIHPGDVLVIP